MSSRPRRNQPTRPYRPVSPRRLFQEAKRRLYRQGVRGPRAYEALTVLLERHPQVGSGVIYMGDVGMAKRMGRCSKTAHRGKYDLLAAGVVKLHCAGPKMCPCSKCGGQAAGGRILNSNGKPVAAATGYEFDASVLTQRRNGPRPAEPAAYASPAQARRNAERMRALKELLPDHSPP